MNKLKLLVLLFIPFSVSALCSNSDLSRYKSLAANIGNYYSYNGSSFDITFYNVSSELRIVNRNDDSAYYPGSNFGDVVVSNAALGSNIKFSIYPLNSECSSYSVSTVYITLPYLNGYYDDPICVNNSNSLCSKWINTSYYTYEQFVSKVKDTQVIPEEVDVEPEEEVHKYGFFDFLADYYILILLFIIVSGSIGIYYLDKKSKFDF